MLDAILQMPSIVSSTNIKFSFHQIQPYGYGYGHGHSPYGANTTQFLPVTAISAWLNRSSNGMIIKSLKQQKSPLKLTVYINSYVQVQNVQELFEHLKKVHLASLLHRCTRWSGGNFGVGLVYGSRVRVIWYVPIDSTP